MYTNICRKLNLRLYIFDCKKKREKRVGEGVSVHMCACVSECKNALYTSIPPLVSLYKNFVKNYPSPKDINHLLQYFSTFFSLLDFLLQFYTLNLLGE